MSVSDKVKGLLALCGKKQVDMAASFGMSKQTMGNKMNRGSWYCQRSRKGCGILRLQTGVYYARRSADHH